ncbi:Uma2 family endonuclease [Actinoplanes sp. NPDC051859]|uniref:Uma2 family endonuclease n=1 Tax=Actinoplanes sp. NPDC051859 TaxID=3363909 RepID=UPI00379F3CD1
MTAAIRRILSVDVVLALRAHCPPDHAPVPGLALDIGPTLGSCEVGEPGPDVVVGPVERLDRDPVSARDVLLAAEIVAPGWHYHQLFSRTKAYAAAGIPHYWVIDLTFAEGITISEYRLVRGDYEAVGSTRQMFETELPYPVTVDLPALTARHCRPQGAG